MWTVTKFYIHILTGFGNSSGVLSHFSHSLL